MSRPHTQKLFIFALYLLLAVLAAAAFGALHDQISYMVSQEYFTKFKFVQFRLLDTAVPERLRAATVGVLATWWMGIPIGVLTGLAGLVHRTPELMKRALLWSLSLIMGLTLAFALLGLVYGFIQTAGVDLVAYPGWYLPKNLEHPRRFICAGYMHNAAYLGGMLSIPAAWLFHIRFKRRTSRESSFSVHAVAHDSPCADKRWR